jgi:hypothetical protein
MTNKFVLCFTSIALILFGLVFLGQQASSAIATNMPSDLPKESSDGTGSASSAGSSLDKSKILTLNFLRDTGLSLQQIQQQSINIYLEVTRKDVQPEDKAILAYPKSISDKALLKTSCYLPPRPERLYVFVSTMEPIVHIFAEDVNDTKAGVTRVFVPKAIKAELSPLWQDWANGIQNLNEHISAVYQLANEEKPDNIAIGKHAVAMYNIGNNLESTLEMTVEKIRKSERQGIQSEPVGIQ